MKRSFWKKRLAAFLAAILVFSVCPEVSFETGENGNVRVSVEANGPKQVFAETEPHVTEPSDWINKEVSDNKICLSGYKGNETVIWIPTTMTLEGVTYPVELVGLKDPAYTDCTASNLISITIESGVTIKVDNADKDLSEINKGLFRGLDILQEVNASGVNFDGNSLTALFTGCSHLKKVDLSQCDLAGIAEVSYMFNACGALETLDLYAWQNIGFTRCYYMFANCTNLTTIYADWDMNKNTNLESISTAVFTDSHKLVGGCGSPCNSGYESAMYGRPDGGQYDSGFFTLKPNPIDKFSYSFANSFAGLQYSDPYRIPESRYIDVFGNKGSFMHYFYNDDWGGSCYGLSGTSSFFNVSGNGINLRDYDSTANAVKDLRITQSGEPTTDKVKKFIEEEQISQFDVRVQLCYILNSGINKTLNTVKNEPYPVIIGLFGPEGGHAVLGYSVEESATEAKIHIYDSNWPLEDCYITATRSGNTGDWTGWYYNLGGRESVPDMFWGNDSEYVSDSNRRSESDITFIPYDVYSMAYMDKGYYNDADWLISDNDNNVWTEDDEEAYLNWVWTKVDEEMYREMNPTEYGSNTKYSLRSRLKYRLKTKLNYRMEDHMKTIAVKGGDAQISTEGGTLFEFRNVGMILNDPATNNGAKAGTPMYTQANKKTTFENTGTGQPLEIAMMDNDQMLKIETDADKVTGTVNDGANGTPDNPKIEVEIEGNENMKSEVDITGNDGSAFKAQLVMKGANNKKTEINLEGKLSDGSQTSGGTGLALKSGKLNTENVDIQKVEVKNNGETYDSDTGSGSDIPINDCDISMSRTMKYTGQEVNPDVSIRYNDRLLQELKDYLVSYSDNINVGTAKVTIIGIGDYKGEKELTFTITRNGAPTSGYTPSISQPEHGTITVNTETPKANDTVTITIASEEGFEVKEVIVKDKNGNPVEVGKNEDGTYSFIQPSDGEVSISANIIRKDENSDPEPGSDDFTIGFAKLTDDPYEGVYYNSETERYEIVYTGGAIKPLIKVMSKTDGVLKEGVDYTVSYSNNTNVSKKNPAVISISGKKNYAGSQKLKLYIIPADLTTAKSKGLLTIADELKVVNGKKADPVMVYRGCKLKNNDRTISNNAVVTADTSIDIKGNGNFTGTLKGIPVKMITEAEAKSNTIKVSIKAGSHVYNGKAHELTTATTVSAGELTVTDGSAKKKLVKDTDFTVKYSRNVNAGKAVVTVTGTGTYIGTYVGSFDITPDKTTEITAALADPKATVYHTVKGAMPDITVSACRIIKGSEKPVEEVLKEDRDYKITYSSNKKIGSGAYTVKFLGNYKGHKAVKGTFEIVQAQIDTARVEAAQLVYKKPGKYLSKPFVSIGGVQLKTSDYTVKYYEGEVTDMTAEGVKELTSKDKLELGKSEESKTVTIAVTGKGNYTGTALGTYKVVKAGTETIDLTKAKIVAKDKNKKGNDVSVAKQEYTGSAIEPKIRIMVKVNKVWTDVDPSLYDISYINNVNRGTAVILVNGKGTKAVGSKNVKFIITNKGINLFKLLF